LRAKILEDIPGCYSAAMFNRHRDEIKHRDIDVDHDFFQSHEEIENYKPSGDRIVRVFEIKAVKEWLKNRYNQAMVDYSVRFPKTVYTITEDRCKSVEKEQRKK